ncbi:GIY-YIG nuclease family protein [Rossellomorea vietnamensis]|uniref:GIY-YIG nuclease family protein n=1 Tax=Rossellomorea vietnamensis TaxID=218284 RepID=A0A5D4M3S1_9BACI|nr:GIY-YIG nuclease family protein [Rossellomorea vietnamensis]TYR95700.1 GIY-YIG nuclease family protein [Rossellomorea vietnamensis]
MTEKKRELGTPEELGSGFISTYLQANGHVRPVQQGGHVMTRDEGLKLIKGLMAFYEDNTDEDIKEFNDKLDVRRIVREYWQGGVEEFRDMSWYYQNQIFSTLKSSDLLVEKYFKPEMWNQLKEFEEAEKEREIKREKRKEPKPGFIYVIQEEGGFFKIGKSVNPVTRLKTLQTSHPRPLQLVHVIEVEDMKSIESKLHDLFESKRLSGEWFELTEEDVEFLKGIEKR